jgi:SPP1 gp7 family putative phage head morphogenesis protein
MTLARQTSVADMARLQDRDITRACGRAPLIAARFWRAVNSDFDAEVVDRLTTELTDIMAYAWLLRRHMDARRRRRAKGIELSFGGTSRLASRYDVDLGNLRKRLKSTAANGVKRSVKDTRKTLTAAIQRATRDGLTGKRARDYVLARLKRGGLAPRGNGYIDTLVRTHASIAYNASHRALYLGDPDLWGFEYVTMEDELVRPSHATVAGIRRKHDDAFWDSWWPPNGWNCRCQVVALYGNRWRQSRVPDGVEPDEGFKTDFNYLWR